MLLLQGMLRSQQLGTNQINYRTFVLGMQKATYQLQVPWQILPNNKNKSINRLGTFTANLQLWPQFFVTECLPNSLCTEASWSSLYKDAADSDSMVTAGI